MPPDRGLILHRRDGGYRGIPYAAAAKLEPKLGGAHLGLGVTMPASHNH
jgi:hypothetical protein